jgi:hypothetical protein
MYFPFISQESDKTTEPVAEADKLKRYIGEEGSSDTNQ